MYIVMSKIVGLTERHNTYKYIHRGNFQNYMNIREGSAVKLIIYFFKNVYFVFILFYPASRKIIRSERELS